MAFAEVNGQRIRFDDSGGDGPPVVLSHGFLMDREMFAPQVDALAPAFRVITWDERGFGETQFDGEPFTYWDSARDCLGLLDHLGIDRAVLGGMSQGGFLSLRAALLAPERVGALVLIDTQTGVEDPERLPAYRQMQEMWLEAGPVDALAETIANLIIGDPVMNQAWIAKWHKLPRETMRAPGDCLMDRDDISDRLSEISALPLSFTAPPISRSRSRRPRNFAGDCRAARASCASKVPHAANLTHPDQVNGPLLEFLRAL